MVLASVSYWSVNIVFRCACSRPRTTNAADMLIFSLLISCYVVVATGETSKLAEKSASFVQPHPRERTSRVPNSDIGCAEWFFLMAKRNTALCKGKIQVPVNEEVVSIAVDIPEQLPDTWDAVFSCRVRLNLADCDELFLETFENVPFFMICPRAFPGYIMQARRIDNYRGESGRTLFLCEQRPLNVKSQGSQQHTIIDVNHGQPVVDPKVVAFLARSE